MLVLPAHPLELSKLTGLGYFREALEGITLCLTNGIKFTLTRTQISKIEASLLALERYALKRSFGIETAAQIASNRVVGSPGIHILLQ